MSNQQFKADAGKTKPDLIEEGFPLALRGLQATTDYGSEKYEEHSWRKVDDAFNRYKRAGARHRQERILSRDFMSKDDESGLPHVYHELFNLMAQIELYFQNNKTIDPYKTFVYKSPPTSHKTPSNPTVSDVHYTPYGEPDVPDEFYDAVNEARINNDDV